ncbi:hypothetical protein J6590_040219 [Homalodisca vitripennis]|nr:hypothetical protein J6590_040219 [Homalodisca vitripennis]
MALVMWIDNKAIMMGSTTSEPLIDVKRWDKNMKNMLMFAVLDQMMEYYRFEYKLACQLQKVKNKDQLGLMAFRMSIAEFLNAGTTRKQSLEHVENDDQPQLRLMKKIRAPVSKPPLDLQFDGYNHWPSVNNLKNPHMSERDMYRVFTKGCHKYLWTQQGSLLAGLYLSVEPTIWPQQKPMCHFNLVNLMDVQERHITNRKFRDSGSTVWEMTVGVGGVCSLTSEVLVNLNKGMSPPACFDWRGWSTGAGLPFFRGDMTLRPLLPNLTHPEYPVTLEAVQGSYRTKCNL